MKPADVFVAAAAVTEWNDWNFLIDGLHEWNSLKRAKTKRSSYLTLLSLSSVLSNSVISVICDYVLCNSVISVICVIYSVISVICVI